MSLEGERRYLPLVFRIVMPMRTLNTRLCIDQIVCETTRHKRVHCKTYHLLVHATMVHTPITIDHTPRAPWRRRAVRGDWFTAVCVSVYAHPHACGSWRHRRHLRLLRSVYALQVLWCRALSYWRCARSIKAHQRDTRVTRPDTRQLVSAPIAAPGFPPFEASSPASVEVLYHRQDPLG